MFPIGERMFPDAEHTFPDAKRMFSDGKRKTCRRAVLFLSWDSICFLRGTGIWRIHQRAKGEEK